MKSTVTRPKPNPPKFTEMTFTLNRGEALLLAAILGNLSCSHCADLNISIFNAVSGALAEEGGDLLCSKEYIENKQRLINSNIKFYLH